MEERYTIRKAVYDTLSVYDRGSDFGGVQFCNDVQGMLNAHNAGLYPMQTSIMRELRRQEDLFNIVVKKYSQSIYHIKSDEEIALNEQQKTLW